MQSMTEAEKLGNARETWCAVERDKAEEWCRTQMKHHKVFNRLIKNCIAVNIL